MTVFKKTILGKILKGAAKVALPVGGAVLGIGAVSGIVKGIGAGAGVGQSLKGIQKVGSKITQSAVNLVTGTTKNERDQVKVIKSEAKDAQDTLDQLQRLINAGASRSRAMQILGITAAELGSANSDEIDKENQTKLATETVMKQGAGCMVTVLCLLGGIVSGSVFILLIIF